MKIKQNKKSFTITPTAAEATLLASLFNQTDIVDMPTYANVGLTYDEWETTCLALTLAFVAVGGDRNCYPFTIRSAIKAKFANV